MTNRDRKELKRAERSALSQFEGVRVKLSQTEHRVIGRKVHYTFSEGYSVREGLNLTAADSGVGRWSRYKLAQL